MESEFMVFFDIIGPWGTMGVGIVLGLLLFRGIRNIQALTPGVTYAFSSRRLFLACLFLLFTLPLTCPDLPAYRGIDTPYPVNAVFLAFNLVFFLTAFRAPRLYCAECGTYIGTKTADCPECGCSDHTKVCRPL